MRLLSFVRPRNSGALRWFTTGLVTTCVAAATACAASQYHVRGTVAAVNPTRIEIRHKSGQVVPIALGPTTAFRRDHKPASLGDLRVGSRVMVLFEERTGPFSATEVRIFTPPARAPRRRSSLLVSRSRGSRRQE